MTLEKTPEKIFVILSTIFISIMIFLMPLNRVPDEITHAQYSWETIFESKTDSLNWRTTLGHDSNINKKDYKKIFTKKIDLSKESYKLSVESKKIQHFPVIFGLWLGSLIYPSIGIMMTLGRVFNALFFIIGLYYIIKYMKFGKYVLTFVGLLPITIQQAASLSYDVPNFLAIALFFAVTSDLMVNKLLTKKRLILLIASLLFLYLTKKNNLILICILPFIGVLFTSRFNLLNKIMNKTSSFVVRFKVIIILLLLVLAAGSSILYFKDKGGVNHFIQVIFNTIFNTNLNPQLNTILTIGMFGYIGWFQMQFPLWLIFIDISVLTILFMSSSSDIEEVPKITTEYSIVSALMFPLQALIIIGGMYIAWTPLVMGPNADISVGAQGRYFTPFLIFLSPLFINMGKKYNLTISRKFLNDIVLIIALINLCIMVFLVINLYWLSDYQTNWYINIIEFIKNIKLSF